MVPNASLTWAERPGSSKSKLSRQRVRCAKTLGYATVPVAQPAGAIRGCASGLPVDQPAGLHIRTEHIYCIHHARTGVLGVSVYMPKAQKRYRADMPKRPGENTASSSGLVCMWAYILHSIVFAMTLAQGKYTIYKFLSHPCSPHHS